MSPIELRSALRAIVHGSVTHFFSGKTISVSPLFSLGIDRAGAPCRVPTRENVRGCCGRTGPRETWRDGGGGGSGDATSSAWRDEARRARRRSRTQVQHARERSARNRRWPETVPRTVPRRPRQTARWHTPTTPLHLHRCTNTGARWRGLHAPLRGALPRAARIALPRPRDVCGRSARSFARSPARSFLFLYRIALAETYLHVFRLPAVPRVNFAARPIIRVRRASRCPGKVRGVRDFPRARPSDSSTRSLTPRTATRGSYSELMKFHATFLTGTRRRTFRFESHSSFPEKSISFKIKWVTENMPSRRRAFSYIISML